MGTAGLESIAALIRRAWFGLTPHEAVAVHDVLLRATDAEILADPFLIYGRIIGHYLAVRADLGGDQHGPLMASAGLVEYCLNAVTTSHDIDEVIGYGTILIVGTRIRGDLAEADRLGELVQRRVREVQDRAARLPDQDEVLRPGQLEMQRGLTLTLMGELGAAMRCYDQAWSSRGESPYRHFAGANAAANAAMLAAFEGHYELAETWLARVGGYRDRVLWSSHLTYLGEYLARALLAADSLDLEAASAACRDAGDGSQAVELWPFVAAAGCAVDLAFSDSFRAYERLRSAAFAHGHELAHSTAAGGLLQRAYLDCLIAMGDGARVLHLVGQEEPPPRTLVPIVRVHLLSGSNEVAARVAIRAVRRDDISLRDQRELALVRSVALMRMNRVAEARQCFSALHACRTRYSAGAASRISPSALAQLRDLCGPGPSREPARELPLPLETVNLTRAETQVLRLLARGCTVAQVSAETFTSVNTVKTHVRSIYRKLGVNKRTEALWRADELGLLGSD